MIYVSLLAEAIDFRVITTSSLHFLQEHTLTFPGHLLNMDLCQIPTCLWPQHTSTFIFLNHRLAVTVYSYNLASFPRQVRTFLFLFLAHEFPHCLVLIITVSDQTFRVSVVSRLYYCPSSVVCRCHYKSSCMLYL